MLPRPLFRDVPDWIYDDPAYGDLSAGACWCLQMIADRCCAETIDDHGSRRGCRVDAVLLGLCGGSRTGFYQLLEWLAVPGFVVKVGASELAIPGARGCLDELALRETGGRTA